MTQVQGDYVVDSAVDMGITILSVVLAAANVAQWITQRKERSNRVADIDATYSMAYSAVERIDYTLKALARDEPAHAAKHSHQAVGLVNGIRSTCQARRMELTGKEPRRMHPARCEQMLLERSGTAAGS